MEGFLLYFKIFTWYFPRYIETFNTFQFTFKIGRPYLNYYFNLWDWYLELGLGGVSDPQVQKRYQRKSWLFYNHKLTNLLELKVIRNYP